MRFIKEHRTVKILHLFRSYSALGVVLSSAFLVSATNLSAGKESSGFLFGYFGEEENYENPLKNKISVITNNQKDNLALVELLEADLAPNPQLAKEAEEEMVLNVQGQSLVAGTSPVRKDPEEEGGVQIYEVQSGDTVSGIAAQYKITVNTILWANAIDDIDSIKPGDKIFILPTDGVSYTIAKNDNLDTIAKKYKSDKERIIAFNNLPANGEIKEGQSIIIPGGQKDIPVPTSTGIAARTYEPFAVSGKKLSGIPGTGHRFPYGYCTWYVAQKRYIPWGGNAGTWLYNAKAMGYATGKTPRPGAIMVSSESWWGHVAIVEKVKGGQITISEMNYAGWGKRSTRTLSTGSRVIKGFIY
ncbi:LysM peptidoglycan-binding domain-containing protein [Patescibacteria group bacterium]|nr:LysM peptidoglycan-binding domain-containing protein [Patescibacteria group bacterium]